MSISRLYLVFCAALVLHAVLTMENKPQEPNQRGVLEQGSTKCLEGMFLNGTSCAMCSRSCKTCIDEYTCTKCILGYARETVTDGTRDLVICEYQVVLAMLIILLVVVGSISLVAILKVVCDRRQLEAIPIGYYQDSFYQEPERSVASFKPIDEDPPEPRRVESTVTASMVEGIPQPN